MNKNNKSTEIDIESIKLYGTDWCGDCFRAKALFRDNNISYEYINIDLSENAKEFVRNINPKNLESIPVIIFTDKSILIDPTTLELLRKLEELNLII